MNNNLKNTILDSLEKKCSNIGNCIIALTSQGYLVNGIKWTKLKLNLLLQEQLKYINSFNDDTQHRIINLFNNLN